MDFKLTHYRVVGEKETTERFRAEFQVSEQRRIWRVLYYHLKSIFESADSGVMEFRDLILSYIVIADGRTVAEHIVPNLARAVAGNPSRLLPERAGA